MVRAWIFVAEVLNVVLATVAEHAERLAVFREARRYADSVGKPLLNYGCGYKEPFVSLSDINVDVVPRKVKNFVLAPPDSARLPFKDKEVVTFCSHVLEHVEDPARLLRELSRISDRLYVVLPKWWNISAWVHPGHRRIYVGRYVVERPQRLALPVLVGLNLLALAT